MQRSFILSLVLFVLLPSSAKAQENSRQPNGARNGSPEGSNSTVVSLLEQSHDLNPQSDLRVRINLLQRQTEQMSRVDGELSQAWAQELLALSRQAKGNLRSYTELSAMRILVRFNPDRALFMLHSLSKEEPQEGATPFLPSSQLARMVFGVVVERDGISALPLLGQEAARIGAADGAYPYSALGHAAVQSVSKEWASNRPHAVEVVQAVFDQAFTRYSEGSRGYADDLEFGTMLQEVAGALPHEPVRPALHLLVKNLLATDTSKYRFQAGVDTKDGESAKVDNAIDAALLHFGSLINRTDPELAQQLESTRSVLRTALPYAQDGRLLSGFIGAAVQPLNRDPNEDTSMDALRLAHINPEAAVAKAEQLPEGDRRASTMLSIASLIAGKQPERAHELIAEVASNNKTGMPDFQLQVISARASLAAAQDKQDELRELLQEGFALATPIITDLQANGRDAFVPGLAPLVQIGMQNDPDTTTTFVQSLPASLLKANLLLGAASALTMKIRLPIGSRELPKPEKSN